MREYIIAEAQAMSDAEIFDIVGEHELEYIKAREEHPVIKVFSVGHPGDANFHFPGFGKVAMHVAQAAVQWIADKLKIGTAVFNRHDPTTNSQEGRVKIGEVVGKAVRKIGNTLNTVAAIHIFPQFADKEFDVASIEAELLFDHDNSQAWLTGVRDVTGIALSHSSTDSPGFPGATLLGAVQAFAAQAFAEGRTNMKKDEIIQAAKDAGVKPSEIYTVDELMADAQVVEKVKAEKHDLWNKGQRLDKEVVELRDKLAKTEETHAAEIATIRQETVRGKTGLMFKEVATTRKLDDKQAAFIEKVILKRYTPTAKDDTELRVEINKLVDDGLKEYGEVTGLITGRQESGDKPEDKTHNKTQNTDHAFDSDAVLEAEMNPKNNPLLQEEKT